MSSGGVAAVRKQIMKFIQYAIYWEKTQIKQISDKRNVTKKHFFSLRSSNTHRNIPFNFQFFYELKAKGSSILKKFAWGFHFLFHLGFTKVYFTLKAYQKTVNLFKKEQVFFSWDSLYARLNSHYKAWSYKKKIKVQKD